MEFLAKEIHYAVQHIYSQIVSKVKLIQWLESLRLTL